jgi:hypothetical protein
MSTQDGYGAPVDLNGTGISMFPVPAEKMMSDIAKILTDVWDGWNTANGRIESLEGKLGDGPMGKPVIKQYNPAVKQIRKVIADTVEQLSTLSEEGTKAPPIYVEADLQAGQNFSF